MSGFIRDEHLAEAEEHFPGIGAMYAQLVERRRAPRTFLDLVAAYTAVQSGCSRCLAVAVTNA